LAEEIWERDEGAQSTEQIFGGCAGVSAEEWLAEDTKEHAGGIVDLEVTFILGENDFTEGFGAAHTDDREALRVVNTAGTGGKNPKCLQPVIAIGVTLTK
jgi:hypothetical protein